MSLLPNLPENIQVASLTYQLNASIAKVEKLEKTILDQEREIKEWNGFGGSLIEAVNNLQKVDRTMISDALIEQLLVLEIKPGDEIENVLDHVCYIQACRFADRFIEKIQEYPSSPYIMLVALHVVGVAHVHSRACKVTEKILADRGWTVEASLMGLRETRAMLITYITNNNMKE